MTTPTAWPEHDCTRLRDAGTPCQHLRWQVFCWCVTQAQQILAADPTAATLQQMSIAAQDGTSTFDPIVGLAQLPPPRDDAIHAPLADYTSDIDVEYALGTDLARPLIAVRLIGETTGTEHGTWVIDGWHRLYHARSKGLTVLPGYLLSADASRAILQPVYVR